MRGQRKDKIEPHLHAVKEQEALHEKTVLGFWIYLLSDLILFGTLFATYFVLFNPEVMKSLQGKGFQESFLMQTITFVTLSAISGLSLSFLYQNKKQVAGVSLASILCLGFIFLKLQMQQFQQLTYQGYRWDSNGCLSAFYTVIGTHTLHVILGLLWTALLLLSFKTKLNLRVHIRRANCLKLFWQFLNIVWVLIWSLIILKGAAL
ncbi:cytochrome c oxidase subunit 3 [Rhabdochlamydiaceae symbiont of Dictyostelium giganteum]|uniref:cytochrome c oxidase subunit 3 n=1 Tax=Rhabdochlamydiaceae symbiont of Dictyostelium giganteum TaxID=3342349 RepID=UPI00384D0580